MDSDLKKAFDAIAGDRDFQEIIVQFINLNGGLTRRKEIDIVGLASSQVQVNNITWFISNLTKSMTADELKNFMKGLNDGR